MDPYAEQLKKLFKKQAPHTVNQAIEMIDKETDFRLKPSACRAFLKKIGMKCRRCGVVPGKAMDDDQQRQAQKAKEWTIELLYLPPYLPNLNLIERLWCFVKKQVLYSKHYDRFDTFRNSINNCISDLGARFKSEMQSLMTMNFQLF